MFISKGVIMLSLCFTLLNFAQAEEPRKIAKPDAGDFSLGFNAVPVLDFALNTINIMNDTGQQGSGIVDFPNGYSKTLSAKYFLSSNMAIRFHVSPNFVTSSDAVDYQHPVDVADSEVSPENVRLISDITDTTSYDFVVGAGAEWRKGGGRLWGTYGAGAILGFAKSSSVTTYGYNFDQKANDLGIISDGDERTLLSQTGLTTEIGLRGFGGIEYFITHRISLGAEYGLYLARSKTRRGTVSKETWNVTDGTGVSSTVEDSAGGESVNLMLGVDSGTDKTFASSNGSLVIHFYF